MKKKDKGGAAALISEEIKELITLTAGEAADTAANRLYLDGLAGVPDYYRITERLLYNYKSLSRLVDDEQAYLRVELHEKSKSVVVVHSDGGGYNVDADAGQEAARAKLRAYERTVSNFHDVEKVINIFHSKKEFIVIRMYYFNEDADGHERGQNDPQWTWEDIAFELSERGLLKDAKTARRWRNNLISDIAVCMFGQAAAAVGVGAFRPKTGQK